MPTPQTREVLRMLDAWKRDLTHAVRSLLRAPAFFAIAALTLALAIGANTAIFSVVDAVLLDPLAYPEADELVVVRGTAPGTDMEEEFELGPEFYLTYRENASALEDLAFAGGGQTTVRSGDHAERLFIAAGPPSLFSTLGVAPVLGRLPVESDEEGQVVLLSHWLWNDWFGRDPGVVGQTIEVLGEIRNIIGVLPQSFDFPDNRTAVYIHDLITPPANPGTFNLNLIGRLAEGHTTETLTAELTALTPRVLETAGGPAPYARILEQYSPVVRTLEEELVGDFATPLWILLGTMGIVLLIACANVANLLMVRAEGRERDSAVRTAMGSSRWGLIRAQMSEALILAATGGVLGVILAWMGVPLVVRAAPEAIQRLEAASINPMALLFTGAVVTVAALVAGILPALKFSKPDLMHGLRSSLRTGASGSPMVRNVLVVVQTAAALVLLVGSGLLLQSFRELRSVDPGYETEGIYTFQFAPDFEAMGIEGPPALAGFHYDFMDRLAALPGVESVGLVNTLPLDEGAGEARVRTQAYDGPAENAPRVRRTMADGNYFRTMGIQLLQGNTFERLSEPTMEVTAIVSRSAAELLWPGENPIGQSLRPAGAPDAFPWITIGGVVEDVILEDFREQTPEPLLYLPMMGPGGEVWGVGTPAYVVKSSQAHRLAPAVRALAAEVAPGAPVYREFTMAHLASRSMARLSFTMLTLFIAATLALVLGAVGIYGTISYVVTRRTREIGIRMALGAKARDVRRMVVRQGGTVALIGVGIGLVAAVFAARSLESLLFEVRARDPIVFAAVATIMLGVALLASYLPARRASAVDPVEAIRTE
ncbi:MAG: ABC transporter permease [Gemmatimonadetes bacterium]|nr:ABC transporter permease [Gemmatimonadota bacterium]